MKHWLLIAALAGAAGFGSGMMFSGRQRGASDAINSPIEKSELKGDGLAGASDPREVALGTALTELLRPAGDLRGLASRGTALDALDSTQVARLVDRLDGEDSRLNDDRLALLFTRWMKRDPTAAAAWIRPRLDALAQDGPTGFLFEMKPRGKLIIAWAEADPQAALEYARNHARTGVATVLLRKAMSVWPDRDDRHRLALVLDFPAGRARATMLYELHRSWASRDPAAAFASAQMLEPGRERNRAIDDILLRWAERDAAAAFASYRTLGLTDSVLLSRVLAKNAAKNPAQTLEWLGQLDASQIARCAPRIVETWAESDPASALGWALANGVRLSPHYQEIVNRIEHNGLGRSSSSSTSYVSPLGKALEKNPEATLAWIRALPAGAERDRIVELAVAASRTREQALSLFSTLPADAAARTAPSIARQFGGDLEKGRAWAESLPPGPVRAQAWAGLGALADSLIDLPPGPDRDAMLSGTLRRTGITPKPAERLARFLEISDPVLRRDMVDALMEDYSQNPFSADEAWAALEQANIPEEWKSRWRKSSVSSP